MPTVNFTPSLDGAAWRNAPDGEDWATIIAGAGTDVDHTTNYAAVGIHSDSITDKWDVLYRSILLYDISSFPTTVTAASLSLWLVKYDDIVITPDFCLYEATPAADDDLVAADYGAIGSVEWSNILAYADLVDSDWNTWALNSTGIAAVNTALGGDGILRLGLRNANYDVAASAPDWGSPNFSGINFWAVEKSGYEPMLTLSYAAALKPQVIMIKGRS